MSIESDGSGSLIEDEPGSPVVDSLGNLGNVVVSVLLGRHEESSLTLHVELKVELLSVLWLLEWGGLLLLVLLGSSGDDCLNSWFFGGSHLALDGNSGDLEVLVKSLSACLPGDWGVWCDGGVSEAELSPLVDFSVDLSVLPGVLLGKLVLEKSDSGGGSVSSGLKLEGEGESSLMEESEGLGS